MKNTLLRFQRFFCIERSRTSSSEKIVATIGAILGISISFSVSYLLIGAEAAFFLVPSMGAAAVLLFAIPHGALSQPWALFMGNLMSAFIGVACFMLVPNIFVAAGLAVGLSIGAMHLLNCIHPPGGATALVAVVGGPVIHDLGFMYIISPVFINVLVIFIVAIIFNSAFAWRRYPISMMRFIEKKTTQSDTMTSSIQSKHIGQAVKDMDLVIDITIEDLKRLFTLTLQHADNDRLSASEIQLGHYYTNGKHGNEWSVRQVIDEAPNPNPKNDLIIYRCSEGLNYGRSDSCSRAEFAQWAVRELIKK
jgi:CBS domain-containing membrane protein